jgi:hypothetical protein
VSGLHPGQQDSYGLSRFLVSDPCRTKRRRTSFVTVSERPCAWFLVSGRVQVRLEVV